MDQDEDEIQFVIERGNFRPRTDPFVTTKHLILFLTDYLQQRYQTKPLVIAFTGAPGSGKSMLVEQVVTNLVKNGHPSDAVSTDDFGLFHRLERNQRISQGADPFTMKDFSLLESIIKDVRRGTETRAPVYDEVTGDAVVMGGEQPPYNTGKFPHLIGTGLHFLFVEGDFQPISDPDLKIYLHVPVRVRRENRISRDLVQRGGYGGAEAIRQSFDLRLKTQYYPYTLPNAEKSDILITTQVKKVGDHQLAYEYLYQIFIKAH